MDCNVSLCTLIQPFMSAYILCSIVNGSGGILLALTYFPKRGSVSGLSKKEILGQIDYVGAFLSVVGITLLSVFYHCNLENEAWLTPTVAWLPFNLVALPIRGKALTCFALSLSEYYSF